MSNDTLYFPDYEHFEDRNNTWSIVICQDLVGTGCKLDEEDHTRINEFLGEKEGELVIRDKDELDLINKKFLKHGQSHGCYYNDYRKVIDSPDSEYNNVRLQISLKSRNLCEEYIDNIDFLIIYTKPHGQQCGGSDPEIWDDLGFYLLKLSVVNDDCIIALYQKN